MERTAALCLLQHSRIETAEYNYVFSEKECTWYVYDEEMKNKQPLKDALIEEYRKSKKDYLFEADDSFRIPISDDKVYIRDIATPEQLERLEVLKADLTQAPKKQKNIERND